MTKLDAEVFLVRHGETAWNAEGRFQGQLDSPLTPLGREHAGKNGRLLPAALAGRAAVTMQVSPLGRTQHTAAIIEIHGAYARPFAEPRIQEVTTAPGTSRRADTCPDQGWLAGLLGGATACYSAPDGAAYDVVIARVRPGWAHWTAASLRCRTA